MPRVPAARGLSWAQVALPRKHAMIGVGNGSCGWGSKCPSAEPWTTDIRVENRNALPLSRGGGVDLSREDQTSLPLEPGMGTVGGRRGKRLTIYVLRV